LALASLIDCKLIGLASLQVRWAQSIHAAIGWRCCTSARIWLQVVPCCCNVFCTLTRFYLFWVTGYDTKK
jgi:hypothetical protein